MGEVVPCLAVGAVVLPDGAPLALAQVGAHRYQSLACRRPSFEFAERNDPFAFRRSFVLSTVDHRVGIQMTMKLRQEVMANMNRLQQPAANGWSFTNTREPPAR